MWVLDEIEILIGGPQGSGIETSMMVLSRAFARRGYGVIADREYFSNITGRHSYIHMLVSANKIPSSLRYPVKILVGADAETVFTHFDDLAEKGVIIYDKKQLNKGLDEVPSIENATKNRISRKLAELGVHQDVASVIKYLEKERRVLPLGLDFEALLRSLLNAYKIDPRQLSRYVSGLVVSSIAVLTGLSEEFVKYGFEALFRGREYLVEQNLMLFKLTRESMRGYESILKLENPSLNLGRLMIVTGNDVVAIAKIVAGVRYQSYYPITPASDESFLMERYEHIEIDGESIGSLVVVQTEDEIAAITSAIGASLAGVRSSTSTSGPGFDLMIEGISWAGANEVPIVITYYQRGGPSTGQPTRGSQSDLLSAVFAGHGEFARVVIASGDHEEVFYDVIEAFNIAEKFQVPVIHLLDKFLANTTVTMSVPKLGEVLIDRGLLSSGGNGYKRFDLRYLVSPRAFLGSPETIMWYTGDEHDEFGHISEDPEERIAMYSKRVEKLRLVSDSMPSNKKIVIYGDEKPDYLIVGWGSVKGVALDAIDVLRTRGLKGAYANVKLLWPFPSDEFKYLVSKVPAEMVVAVEHSYGVNIASLARMCTGFKISKEIVKYTGRPITLDELVEGLDRVLIKGESRVTLSRGA